MVNTVTISMTPQQKRFATRLAAMSVKMAAVILSPWIWEFDFKIFPAEIWQFD